MNQFRQPAEFHPTGAAPSAPGRAGGAVVAALAVAALLVLALVSSHLVVRRDAAGVPAASLQAPVHVVAASDDSGSPAGTDHRRAAAKKPRPLPSQQGVATAVADASPWSGLAVSRVAAPRHDQSGPSLALPLDPALRLHPGQAPPPAA